MSRAPLLFVATALVVFASRLPFLGGGYGADADAWRIALAGRVMAERGGYTISRFPGYPLPEMAASLLARGGPLLMNLATAAASGIAVGFFALSLTKLRCKSPLAACAALAFTPVVFIHSTDSMDYVWALVFLLAAFHCALAGGPVVAGLLIGIAIGCRMTSALMLLPLLLVLTETVVPRGSLRAVLKMTAGAALAGGAAYAPVFMRYGPGFFTYFEGSRPAGKILASATTGVWGSVGIVALSLAAVAGIVHSGRSRPARADPSDHAIPPHASERTTIASAAVIVLYAGSFFLLPLDSGYLIPIVPFAILLAGRFLPRRVFAPVCLALAVSSLVSICERGLCRGPILADQAARKSALEMTESILVRAHALRERDVFIVGPRTLPRIKMQLPLSALDSDETSPATNEVAAVAGGVKFVAYLNETGLREEVSRGAEVYYLEGARETNLKRTGLDLERAGAHRLIGLGE